MESLFSILGDTEIDYELQELKVINYKWAYVWGTYTITDRNQQVVDKGK